MTAWSLQDFPELDLPFTGPIVYEFAGTTLAGLSPQPADPQAFAAAEWAYMLSQYRHGEAFAVVVAERVLAAVGQGHASRSALERLLDDERRHLDAFTRYLQKRLGSMVPPAAAVRETVLASAEHADPLIGAYMLHVVVEPFGIGSILANSRFAPDPVLTRLLVNIAADEARHMQLIGLLAPEPVDLDVAATWVRAGIAAMRASSCPIELYADEFGDAAQRVYGRALAGPGVARQARRVAATMGRTLRSHPRLAERLGPLGALFETPYADARAPLLHCTWGDAANG